MLARTHHKKGKSREVSRNDICVIPRKSRNCMMFALSYWYRALVELCSVWCSLKEAPWDFGSMLARAPVFFIFYFIFMFSLFKVTKSHRKATSNVRTIVYLANIIKMIYVIKLRLQEGRRSPKIIWLYV